MNNVENSTKFQDLQEQISYHAEEAAHAWEMLQLHAQLAHEYQQSFIKHTDERSRIEGLMEEVCG